MIIGNLPSPTRLTLAYVDCLNTCSQACTLGIPQIDERLNSFFPLRVVAIYALARVVFTLSIITWLSHLASTRESLQFCLYSSLSEHDDDIHAL